MPAREAMQDTLEHVDGNLKRMGSGEVEEVLMAVDSGAKFEERARGLERLVRFWE